MDKLPTDRDSNATSAQTNGSAMFTLLATFGDTTWRMFVPTIGMTLLGVWGDAVWRTKPWLMIAGIVIGMACAVVLVVKQFRRVKREGSTN